MFKGFGTPKYSADERQMAASAVLSTLLKDDNKHLSRINAGSNLAYILYPDNDGFLTNTTFDFSVGELPLRWDLLNPGCPDLVGIRMFTKCGHLKVLDGTRNCFTAIYDRSKKLISYALQIDAIDKGTSSHLTVDLNQEDASLVETPKRNGEALARFTHWSVYEMSLSMVPKDDLARRDAVESTLKEMMGNQWDDVFASV